MKEPEWSEWVKSRPEPVRTLCKKYPPDKLYLMTDTGQRVRIYSYSEDGTVRVNVTQADNPQIWVSLDRSVFGVNPSTLQVIDD